MNNVYIFDNLLMNPHKLVFPSYWIGSFSELLLSSHKKLQQGRLSIPTGHSRTQGSQERH